MQQQAKRDRLYLEQDADLAPLRGKLIALAALRQRRVQLRRRGGGQPVRRDRGPQRGGDAAAHRLRGAGGGGFSAEKAYSETFYELQFVAESLTRGRLGDTSGSPTAVYDLDRDYDAMNAVYREYFGSDRLPARATVGVSRLAKGLLVEISCIAVTGTPE